MTWASLWQVRLQFEFRNFVSTNQFETSIWQAQLNFNLANQFGTRPSFNKLIYDLDLSPQWGMWFGTSILKPQFSSWIETWIWVFIIIKSIMDVTFKMSIWHFFFETSSWQANLESIHHFGTSNWPIFGISIWLGTLN